MAHVARFTSGESYHVRLPSGWSRMLVFLGCGTLLPHVAAFENDDALGPTTHQSGGQGYARQGFFIQHCFLIGGVALTASSLLGPLMGICSMLWLMMRNDAAVDPRLAWMMFGAWLLFSLTYFMFQCHRVSNHRLYIFLSITLACICICVVALLQRASLQNGLVTVIPPCTSFAAYSVAYFFPDRRQESTSEV
ncbi:hypothetical protein BU23DRAFT_602915 [Bimuria novae-zelandiae CBS 107.79]|uniref:Uncharacterized protein n=1 Tax=Bimuria novae-zelandiae CBS 107.79 TaxID=1447943 RepID=A0A6A5UR51_9PLEO|nr:hypothetical protein BU23DRAFT_602915 [Bimuria novae-zelandiae CBS 107.79]